MKEDARQELGRKLAQEMNAEIDAGLIRAVHRSEPGDILMIGDNIIGMINERGRLVPYKPMAS